MMLRLYQDNKRPYNKTEKKDDISLASPFAEAIPAEAALSTAEEELNELLRRWRDKKVEPNEMPAILRRRAYVACLKQWVGRVGRALLLFCGLTWNIS